MNTPTSTSLFVPVDLQTFCVGVYDVQGKDGSGYGTENFADIAADFSQLPAAGGNAGPYISSVALPGPFQDGNSAALQTGVHLHWALPDALSHGQSDDHGEVQFPEAPNRWLVVRIVEEDHGPDMAAWVVESDQLWDKESGSTVVSRAIPVQPSSDAPTHKTMGKVVDWVDWSEPGPGSAIAKHTALGYGETSYAAAYARCSNVFGFYDPLTVDADSPYAFTSSDTTKSWNFSYLVIGWFSEPDQDPLTKLPESTVEALEAAYKWTYPSDADAPFPTSTFCHGLVSQLHWEPGQVYVTPPDNDGIQVSIGNNTAEALSALLAHEMNQPSYESLLNILQLDLLNELDTPGGAGQVEEKMHAAGYGRTSAGPLWLVKRKDADGAQRSQDPSQKAIAESLLDAASAIDRPLPDQIAGALDALNLDQMAANRLDHEIESQRGQLFADWYKYMVLEHEPSPEANDALQYLEAQAKTIAGDHYDGQGGLMQTLVSLQATVAESKKALEQTLDGHEMELVQVQAPRYHHAADPVVLFSGDSVMPSARHGGDGRFDADNRLICRLDTQAVTTMQVEGRDTVHAADLPALAGPSTPPPQAPRIATLVAEALFTLPGQAKTLAAIAGAAGLETEIAAAQQNLLAGERDDNKQVTFSGLTPSLVGYNDWGGATGANPWIPLLMQWEVDYHPLLPIKFNNHDVETEYPANFITENYVPDDGAMPIELVLRTSQPAGQSQTYSGTTFLTSNVEVGLVRQISTLIENDPDDPNIAALKAIKAYLTEHPPPQQSQALGGFNQALAMREQVLQLPVYDPLQTSFLVKKFVNEELPQVIGDHNNDAPLPLNYYNPVRAGSMQITRLRVIDAFGQVLHLDHPDTLVAQSLQPPGGLHTSAPINLAPRITQPSRLLFRWIAAADDQVETNSHPVTTPIFGWVLFNHLDDSLAVYDADGVAIGSFNQVGPVWQGAPGSGDYGQTDPASALRDLPASAANTHLSHFVTGLYDQVKDGDTGYLEAMLAAIDRSVTTISPAAAKQHPGLSVLIGRPLALTRAALKLELHGLPALDQSWEAFKQAAPEATPYEQRASAAFTGVEFPVQLGDLSKVSDGMIGYFLTPGGNDDASDYGTFYAPAIAGSDHLGYGVDAPDFDHVRLKPSTTYQADEGNNPDTVYLSLLVDPRCPVHATSGILPTKQIDIPPDFYARALQRMAVTFLTAPVLSSAAKLSVPVPSEPGYAWSWVTTTGTEWTTTDQIDSVNPKAAFSYPPQLVQEGWLRLQKRPDEPAPEVAP